MEGAMAVFVALTGLIILLGLIVTIIWISLPFAIFGIKPRLERTIELLEAVEKQQDETLKFLKILAKIAYANSSQTRRSSQIRARIDEAE